MDCPKKKELVDMGCVILGSQHGHHFSCANGVTASSSINKQGENDALVIAAGGASAINGACA
jgi:hypothetical protein